MNDDEIIALFFARSEKAITETQARYGRTCLAIAGKFLDDGRDAEECLNDTMLTLWNTIPPERPTNLGAYAYAIIRNKALTRFDYNTAEKRNNTISAPIDELEDFLPDESVSDGVEDRQITEAINSFLRSQNEKKRYIFIRRYFYADSLNELATDVGMTVDAIRNILFRMRKQLKDKLCKDGICI